MSHHAQLSPSRTWTQPSSPRGSTRFEAEAHIAVLQLARDCPDFDALLEAAPLALLATRRSLGERVEAQSTVTGAGGEIAKSMVFLVGHSSATGGFTAVGHGSDFNFTPFRFDGLYAMPSPLDRRPGPLELHRLEAHLRRNHDRIGDGTLAQVEEAIDGLRALPPGPVPASWPTG